MGGNIAKEPSAEGAEAERVMITAEQIAERVLRTFNLSGKDNTESIIEILRTALSDARDESIIATKMAGIKIAEEEAE